MHSSRMSTDCISGNLGGVVPPPPPSKPHPCVHTPAQVNAGIHTLLLRSGACWDTPLPHHSVDRMTDSCENISFTSRSVTMGKNASGTHPIGMLSCQIFSQVLSIIIVFTEGQGHRHSNFWSQCDLFYQRLYDAITIRMHYSRVFT